jgi:site-specific recombinase XerD
MGIPQIWVVDPRTSSFKHRHTTCNWMSIAGANLKEIQAQAGHKDISMSARYSHLSPSHSRAATSLIKPPE